jgi:hypothetical protein
MAWLYNGRTLKVGKSWTDDNGYKHPYNWATAWSDADKTKWGVTWQDDVDTSYDDRFYWAKDVERSLTDINVVDEDGNAVIDPTTGVQQIQLGLKSQWIAQTKATAQEKLNKHDWMIIRNAEQSTAIPSEISTYRDAVRSACNTIETAINECSDLDAFKLLFIAPTDADGNPTGNAPIYDFPEEV